MKKIITIVGLLGLIISGSAQDKSFRFGLKVDPSFNWLAPDNKKDFENGGMVIGFGVGAITDFKLGGNIWFSSGVSMDFGGAKLNYLDNDNGKDTTGYLLYDDAIVEIKDISTDSATLSQYSFYQLNQRKYKVNYINIPLLLKMKTNEIGYMVYQGQFGLLTGVRTKARVEDQVTDSGNASTLSDLNADSEAGIVKLSLAIGAGFEYNFSGSTSLFLNVGYNYGFSNLTKKTSKHLIDVDETTTAGSYQAYTPQKNIPHAVRLTVGILF